MRKLLLLLSVLALAGCATPSSSPSGPTSAPSSGTSAGGPSGGSSGGVVGAPEPSDSVSDFHITYGFAVPTPVSLPGNAFLRVVFTDAEAHSVAVSPPATIGLPNLRGYAPAGDFEGHVTYGLGLQGGTRPQIRSGELTRADPGGIVYVVFIDVRATA